MKETSTRYVPTETWQRQVHAMIPLKHDRYKYTLYSHWNMTDTSTRYIPTEIWQIEVHAIFPLKHDRYKYTLYSHWNMTETSTRYIPTEIWQRQVHAIFLLKLDRDRQVDAIFPLKNDFIPVSKTKEIWIDHIRSGEGWKGDIMYLYLQWYWYKKIFCWKFTKVEHCENNKILNL